MPCKRVCCPHGSSHHSLRLRLCRGIRFASAAILRVCCNKLLGTCTRGLGRGLGIYIDSGRPPPAPRRVDVGILNQINRQRPGGHLWEKGVGEGNRGRGGGVRAEASQLNRHLRAQRSSCPLLASPSSLTESAPLCTGRRRAHDAAHEVKRWRQERRLPLFLSVPRLLFAALLQHRSTRHHC